jgi:hypothetical protein
MDRQLLGGEKIRHLGHVHWSDKALVSGDQFRIGRAKIDRAQIKRKILSLIGQGAQGRGFRAEQAHDFQAA